MADRRYEDELRRNKGGPRDPETERRIERLADRYRGSDERGYGGGERRLLLRKDRGDSPSGAFHDQELHPRDHSRLAGLHDLEDMSELRERYRGHPRQPDSLPRYGHGPAIENMDPPRTGYGTAPTRSRDYGLGHGGMLGAGNYRPGEPMPRGRGPKGYQRTDDRIREDICDGLMMSWMNAENVEVQVRDGEVTLQGTVKSRDEKRAIEALAESVLGVKELINSLRVERRDQPRAEPQEQRTQESQRPPAPGDTSLHS